MLEKYKNEQPIMYQLLNNAIVNNKLSHAYLFETNNNSDSLDIIYSFVADLFAFEKKSCNLDNVYDRIINGNYFDLNIINPDGLQIKKEQLVELQEKFNKVSLEYDKKVYIINQCEKLNLQAANSILKFLEEPIDNIIAILVTNNINRVPITIVSRCQVISLVKKKNVYTDDGFNNISLLLINDSDSRQKFLDEKENFDKYNSVFEFIDYLEKNKIDTLIYTSSYFHNKFINRVDSIFAFEVMVNFYYDVLRYKHSGQVLLFFDKLDLVKKISEEEDNIILNKIKLLIDLKKDLSNNANIKLLIDYLILKFESVV